MFGGLTADGYVLINTGEASPMTSAWETCVERLAAGPVGHAPGHARSRASTSGARCRTPSCWAAFAALTGVVSLDAAAAAIQAEVPAGRLAERNAPPGDRGACESLRRPARA